MGVNGTGRPTSPCQRAETRYLSALRTIFARSEHEDAPLRKLLAELVDSAADRERQASRTEAPGTVASSCPVPPLRVEVGEGNLDRDQALYLAERVTEEMAAFYWSAWEAAPGEWRDPLRVAAELREGWVERLRYVIL